MGWDWNKAGAGFFTGGPKGLLAGGLAGGDPAKKQYHALLKLFKQIQAQQNATLGQGLAAQHKGLGALEGGYNEAIKQAGAGFGSAKQSVYDNQSQALGSLQGQLAKSGLGNTTVNGNLAGQVYGQGSKQLASIDEQLAQIMAGLHAQKGQAMAGPGGYGGLSSFMQNKAQANSQLGQALASMMAGVSFAPSPWDKAGEAAAAQWGTQQGANAGSGLGLQQLMALFGGF